MKRTKTSEDIVLAQDKDLELKDKTLASLNWVGSEPLKIGATYILVPQLNTAVVYKINGVDRPTPRFWALELDEDGEISDARTIGLGALTGMYVAEFSDDVPEYETTVDSTTHRLKAVVDQWLHASNTTKFISGQTKAKRAAIEDFIQIVPTFRGKVFVLDYDFDTTELKTINKNKKKIARAIVNDHFYKFMATPLDLDEETKQIYLDTIKKMVPKKSFHAYKEE